MDGRNGFLFLFHALSSVFSFSFLPHTDPLLQRDEDMGFDLRNGGGKEGDDFSTLGMGRQINRAAWYTVSYLWFSEMGSLAREGGIYERGTRNTSTIVEVV